jgi:hypothetical protein
MLWSEVLNKWENGNVFTYPNRLNGKFHWNTSALEKDGNVKFSERFKVNPELPMRQNKKSFSEKIDAAKNKEKYVTNFPNLSGDTILVIPMPKSGKSYATLKDFSDNAPLVQQQELWKKVAKLARKQMKKFGKVYISTHGLGVPYLHVRICNKPKYYFSKVLSK